jgi:hypothetical protein
MAELVEGLRIVSDPLSFCRGQSANDYKAIYFVKGEFSPEWDPIIAEKTRFNPLEWLPVPTSVCTAYLQFLYGPQEFGNDKFQRINIYTGPGPSLYFFRASLEAFKGIHDPGVIDSISSFLSAEDALNARPVARAFKKIGQEVVCSFFGLQFNPEPFADRPASIDRDVVGLKNEYDPFLRGIKNECAGHRLGTLYIVFDDGKSEHEEIHTSYNQLNFEMVAYEWPALNDLLTITNKLVFAQYFMNANAQVFMDQILSSNRGLQIVVETLILSWDILEPLQHRDRIFVDLALHPEPGPGSNRFAESLSNITAAKAELHPVSVSFEGEEFEWSDRVRGYIPKLLHE